MKHTLLTAFLAGAVFTIQAQQVRPANSGQIYREISQLNNLANVLYFAAHPDDENTRFLAWMVNDQHVRTAYLSLTRGDGGQNILGSEQGAALGLIRTYELLEARKLDGAEQFFTTAVDFGFSKTSDETFHHWDSTRLVENAVWVIRHFRPDVIVCRFPPNAMAGHGHHAASAIIAEKAFHAAGDKTKFPEQLQYHKTWQPKRILFNAFRFGRANTTTEDMFKLPVGNYSPLLGMGYGELAGISRSIHRSQGAGTPSTPGVQKEYFQLVAGDSFKNSLFDGIDITWNRVDRPDIGRKIDAVLKQFDFKQPEASLPALLEIRKEIATVKDKYWRTQKLAETDNIILHCSGLMAEVFTRNAEAVFGDTLDLTMNMIARADLPVTVQSINRMGNDTTINITLQKDSLYSMQYKMVLPDTISYTEPYWLAVPSASAAHYKLPYDSMLNYPVTPPALNIRVSLKIGEENFIVPVPLSYKKLDPTHGDVIEQLRIVPPHSFYFMSGLTVVTPDSPMEVFVKIHPFRNVENASLVVYSSKNLLQSMIQHINLKKDIDTVIRLVFDTKNLKNISDSNFYLTGTLGSDFGDFSRTQHIIKYEHLPTLQYFTEAYTKVISKDWKTKVKRIGYVEGAGDEVAEILQATGLNVDILTDRDITAKNLKKYDAVLTGIRVVNTERKMPTWMHELLQYVEEGGTLVMQYNTMQDMATTTLGPYPFALSRSRVTEEDAAVTFLAPDHKLMNSPNKITQKDFEGWVQERGLYFPEKADEHYQTLYSMHDAGEDALNSATLYTPYGKGHYIYTSLAFFRQLPAGNKGAIKMLMNMLSAGK